MKNILFILFSILSLSVFGQVQDTAFLTGKVQMSQSGAGSGYWQVSGTFTDESGLFDSGSIQVGDILFFSDAGIGYHLPITNIVSATPPSFVVRVSNVGITNIISVPTGSGVIYRPSSADFLNYTSGISNPDQQTYLSYLSKKLDALGVGGNGIYGGSGLLPNSLVEVGNTQGIKFAAADEGTLLFNKENGAFAFIKDSYTDSLKHGLVINSATDTAAIGVDKDGKLQILSNNWVAIGNDQAKIIIRKDDGVVLIKTGNNVYSLADGVPLSGKNNVMLWPNGSASGRFANLDSLVDGRAKRDTFITVPPNTNYFQNIIDYPSRFYNNIHLSCKGRTDTSIVAFLGSPVWEEQKGVTYNIKNDSGFVAAFVISNEHFSNSKRLYVLKRGQTAQVRLLPDAANPGQYGWAVNVVWDSIGDGNGIISALPFDTVTINNAKPLRILNGTHAYNFDGFSTMWTNSAGGKYFGLQGNNASGWNAGFGVRAAGNYSLEREAHAASPGYNARIFDITYLPWNGYAVPHDAMNITSEGEVVHAYGDPFGIWGSRTEFYATTSYASSKRSFLFKNVTSYHADKKLVDFQNNTGTIAALKQNGKFYVGADSSFIHDPVVDSTLFKGNIQQIGNFSRMSGTNAGRNFPNIILFKSDAAYSVPGTSYNTPGTGAFNWYISNDQRNYGEDGFGIKNENLHSPGVGPGSYYTLFTIRNNANVELGYPYVSRLVRACGDTFAVQSTYNALPGSAVSAPFLVVSKSPTAQKIRFFNAYEFPKVAPSPTNNVKSIMTWTGTGSETTPAFEQIRKDTTVYIDNADLDWTSGITTEKIGRLYHTVIFWMTTTAAAGSNSDLTLPVPDVNLMQTRFEVHSVDEAGGFNNVIKFGSNNAVDSTNGLVSTYNPAAGQLVVIRSGLRSGVYKYRYSNIL